MARKTASLILLFCILALGCTSVPEPKLAGGWVCKKTGETMQLLDDHSCMIYSTGQHYQGRWSGSKSNVRIEAGPIILIGGFDGKKIEVEETVMHGKFTFERLDAAS
jgi:hypothetical protein